MKVHICCEPSQGASYDELLNLALAAEKLGFAGFACSDHYVNGTGRARLPGPTDAWTTIAGLSRETTRLRLGTLVTPVTFRLPGPLAITVAQIDAMSHGRVELGLGAGWLSLEHSAYGIPFPGIGTRFDMLAEQLAVIRGLWSTPEGATFDFAGEHYSLSASPAVPKPVQQPHPPIIMGGSGGPRSLRLAAQYATEFNVPWKSKADSAAIFDRLRDVMSGTATEREMRLSVAQMLCVGTDHADVLRRAELMGKDLEQLSRTGIAGTPDHVLGQIEELSKMGVDRIYVAIPDINRIEYLEVIAELVLGPLASLA